MSFDNTLMATGGEDNMIRLFSVSKDCREMKKVKEFDFAEKRILSVDISAANTVLMATSDDGNGYIIDLKTDKVMQKLSFKCKPNMKNMVIKTCKIMRDSSILTLHNWPQEPSYLIKWRPVDNQG